MVFPERGATPSSVSEQFPDSAVARAAIRSGAIPWNRSCPVPAGRSSSGTGSRVPAPWVQVGGHGVVSPGHPGDGSTDCVVVGTAVVVGPVGEGSVGVTVLVPVLVTVGEVVEIPVVVDWTVVVATVVLVTVVLVTVALASVVVAGTVVTDVVVVVGAVVGGSVVPGWVVDGEEEPGVGDGETDPGEVDAPGEVRGFLAPPSHEAASTGVFPERDRPSAPRSPSCAPGERSGRDRDGACRPSLLVGPDRRSSAWLSSPGNEVATRGGSRKDGMASRSPPPPKR